MGYLTAFKIGSSALKAQQLRLDIISNNIANAETTRTEAGGPYQRQDVVFKANEQNVPFGRLVTSGSGLNTELVSLNGVQVNKIVTDTSPGTTVYDPTHPDADENGYVTYPNVNMVVEMTNMLSATRSYEASLSVIEAARSTARSAISIGQA
ncbi:MAG: flagellar basal body rod protein FlgC [Anaerolineae bacterium]|nr:flagellar basal body rod protein FlgC [Anaerolineae bacterium]